MLIPRRSIRPEVEGRRTLDELSKTTDGAMAAILVLMFWLIVLLAALIYIPICACMPLWTRVFAAPEAIRRHLEGVWLSMFAGLVVFVVLLILRHFWGIVPPDKAEDPYSLLGLLYGIVKYIFIICVPTLCYAWIQLFVSSRYRKSWGNGFGVVNLLYCPLLRLIKSRISPTHVFTVLQDLILLYFIALQIISFHNINWWFLIFYLPPVVWTWRCDCVEGDHAVRLAGRREDFLQRQEQEVRRQKEEARKRQEVSRIIARIQRAAGAKE